MEYEKEAGWLIVLGHIDGFRWVISASRMAFSESVGRRASKIAAGDQLFFYLSAGAYRRPKHEGQLIGLAAVASPVRRLQEPVVVGAKQYTFGCNLDLGIILKEREGIPFRPLIEHLSFIRRKEVWPAYLFSSPIHLSYGDADILRRQLHARMKDDRYLVRASYKVKEKVMD